MRHQHHSVDFLQEVEGITTMVFSPPSEVFASPDENEDNAGFCEPKPCLGTGLLRVSNCRHKAPLVMSQPHLCDADEKVAKSIDGINPDPEKHKTRLYIDPHGGEVVQVKAVCGFRFMNSTFMLT